MQPRWKVHARRGWRFFRPIVIIVVGLCICRSIVLDWNDVPTGSMKPTILEGDRILVNKLSYDLKVPFTTTHLGHWSDPKRGDIVVFNSPADNIRLVKRVIGLPGDIIEVRSNRLIINGTELEYGPLDRKYIDALNPREQPIHDYLSEQLGTHNHPWINIPRRPNDHQNFPPTQRIPPGYYFMMGDNRDDSKDSRYFGLVERSRIVGRAFAVAASLDFQHGWKPRWNRFFSALP